jgi:K+ transporter
VLSLIFWSMMIVVTIKYVAIIMRADNNGEGGSLALLALISRKIRERRWRAQIVLLGVFACALFYGDSMITPAISVLSAVEGLQTVEPRFAPFVVPIAVIILVRLFSIQAHGTARVGTFFGPIMLVYFAAISVFGIMHVAGDPAIVLHTLHPLSALNFFLVTKQAIHLGFVPRLRICHTSEAAAGQIYIPVINWALMAMVILLVLVFGSSTNLAAAYGIAVTGAIFIDGCLLAVVLFGLWKWPAWIAVPTLALFYVVDIAYLGANLMKVPEGGWFPLLIGIVAFTLLTTWAKGRKLLVAQMRETEFPAEAFIDSAVQSATRVPGTAIYMTSQPKGRQTPLATDIKGMAIWRERLFAWMMRNAESPMRFFCLPPHRVVELGAQVKI